MRSAGKFEPILTTRGLTKCRHLGDVCKKHLLSHHCGIWRYLSLADVYQSGKHLPNWENMFIIDIRGWKDYWHNSLLAGAVIPSVDGADFWLSQIFLQLPRSRRWTLVSNWNQDSKSEICFEAIGPLLLQCTMCTSWDSRICFRPSSSVQWAAGGQRSNCSCCSSESSEWRQLWFQLEWQQQKFQETFVCCLPQETTEKISGEKTEKVTRKLWGW